MIGYTLHYSVKQFVIENQEYMEKRKKNSSKRTNVEFKVYIFNTVFHHHFENT